MTQYWFAIVAYNCKKKCNEFKWVRTRTLKKIDFNLAFETNSTV